MLSSGEVNERFEAFCASIENGCIITDAIVVISYLEPDQVDGNTTTYQQAIRGKASVHRCLGLLEVAKYEMLTADDAP